MNFIRTCLLIAVAIPLHNASAALLHFEFGGRSYDQASIADQPVITGEYEGYFTLDSSVPNSIEFPFAPEGIYEQSVLAGSVTINGTAYWLSEAETNAVTVYGLYTPYDSFEVSTTLVNSQGDEIDFVVLLIDRSDSIFDDNSFPTGLSLTDFDSHSFDFFGSIAYYTIPETELLTVDYAQLQPIPLPASLWLFGSALVVMFNARRSRAA